MTHSIRPWLEHEDEHILDNYTGVESIPDIAKFLKRTEVSVAKRIAATINSNESESAQAQRQASILHALDLLKSGGRWR